MVFVMVLFSKAQVVEVAKVKVALEVALECAILKRRLALGKHRVVGIPLLAGREAVGEVAVHCIVRETLERGVAVERNRIHVYKYRLNHRLRPQVAATLGENHPNLCKYLSNKDLQRSYAPNKRVLGCFQPPEGSFLSVINDSNDSFGCFGGSR